MNKDALRDLGVTDFDAASELSTVAEAREFLQACIEEAPEDGAFIAHALGTVARAQARMATIAGQSGLSRESLYKALSGSRDPAFSTILKVTAGLGLRLAFVSVNEKDEVVAERSPVPLQTANSGSGRVEVSWIRPGSLSKRSYPTVGGNQTTGTVRPKDSGIRTGTVAMVSVPQDRDAGPRVENSPRALASTDATLLMDAPFHLFERSVRNHARRVH